MFIRIQQCSVEYKCGEKDIGVKQGSGNTTAGHNKAIGTIHMDIREQQVKKSEMRLIFSSEIARKNSSLLKIVTSAFCNRVHFYVHKNQGAAVFFKRHHYIYS